MWTIVPIDFSIDLKFDDLSQSCGHSHGSAISDFVF